MDILNNDGPVYDFSFQQQELELGEYFVNLNLAEENMGWAPQTNPTFA